VLATTTVYIFSGSKVLAEYDNGAAVASPSREYIYAGAQLVATISGASTTYHHPDHLSTRVSTDSSGTVVRTFGHFPFGESWYETGSASKLKFTSYERDSESANDYAMARSYVNRLARFSSPDPVAGSLPNPQSFNRYAYVLNDAVNLADPLGLFALNCADPRNNCLAAPNSGGAGGEDGTPNRIAQGPDLGGGNSSGTSRSPAEVCIDPKSLNFLQKAQLFAAQAYAKLTGWTFGFGAGLDAGAGAGPKGTSWNFGLGGSASTLIVADASGNSGFLNSASGGFAAVKMSSAGSWWGAGAAAGPSVLVSPFSINTIAGPSVSVSGGGGSGVLGGGGSINTSGALTLTAGWGAGAEAGVSPQFGTSQFIPFCKN